MTRIELSVTNTSIGYSKRPLLRLFKLPRYISWSSDPLKDYPKNAGLVTLPGGKIPSHQDGGPTVILRKLWAAIFSELPRPWVTLQSLQRRRKFSGARQGLINFISTKTPDSVAISHRDSIEILFLRNGQPKLVSNKASFVHTHPILTPNRIRLYYKYLTK